MEEVHKLSTHIFGIQHVRHFKVNCPRSTDSINSSYMKVMQQNKWVPENIATVRMESLHECRSCPVR